MNNLLKNSTGLNAPSFAYYVRTGKMKHIYGREYSHKGREINGITIDYNIPLKEISLLMSISEIEMRSSCEGSDLYGPFFIFRIPGKDINYINKFCEKMNTIKNYNKIICKFGLGSESEYRVIITSTFTNKEVNVLSPEYKEWWKITVKNLIDFFNKK